MSSPAILLRRDSCVSTSGLAESWSTYRCPFTRCLWIEDHEGPAGLEDRQKGDDVVGRPLETHADDHVGAHPPVTEEARHPVGTGLELPIGVVLALALHGDGVG